MKNIDRYVIETAIQNTKRTQNSEENNLIFKMGKRFE